MSVVSAIMEGLKTRWSGPGRTTYGPKLANPDLTERRMEPDITHPRRKKKIQYPRVRRSFIEFVIYE